MPRKNNRDKENIILPFFTTGRFGPLGHTHQLIFNREGSAKRAEMDAEVLSRSGVANVRVCGRDAVCVCARTLCKREYPSLIYIPHH
jgi:hypothetical protein